MGEMKQSIKFHYSKGRILVLKDIANDETVDEDDRELANEYIKKLEKDRDEER